LAVIPGEEELERGEVAIKDLADGRQWSAAIEGIADEVSRALGPAAPLLS
jgi:histidyl-tRNA synthetase